MFDNFYLNFKQTYSILIQRLINNAVPCSPESSNASIRLAVFGALEQLGNHSGVGRVTASAHAIQVVPVDDFHVNAGKVIGQYQFMDLIFPSYNFVQHKIIFLAYFCFERFVVIISEEVCARVSVILRRDVPYACHGLVSHPLAELKLKLRSA